MQLLFVNAQKKVKCHLRPSCRVWGPRPGPGSCTRWSPSGGWSDRAGGTYSTAQRRAGRAQYGRIWKSLTSESVIRTSLKVFCLPSTKYSMSSGEARNKVNRMGAMQHRRMTSWNTLRGPVSWNQWRRRLNWFVFFSFPWSPSFLTWIGPLASRERHEDEGQRD